MMEVSRILPEIGNAYLMVIRGIESQLWGQWESIQSLVGFNVSWEKTLLALV